MSQNTDHPAGASEDKPTAETRPPESGAELHGDNKTGDILRKERIKRRIAIETIARDLKLNARYIKALEANDRANLPSTPYIRVYLRSIAKYLMLDAEKLLSQFYQEFGLDGEWGDKAKNKLNVSMDKNQPRPVPWLLLIVLAAVLVAAGLVARKAALTGGFNTSPAIAPADSLPGNTDPDFDSTLPLPPDTLGPDDSERVGEVEVDGSDETSIESKVPPTSMLRLTIRAVKDSVWVQVFSDGESWRNYVRTDKTRVFAARDSFNVHVGNNANLRYTLNGKPLTTIKGKGVITFRIGHNGAEVWSLRKWMKVFKGRR